MLPQPAAAVYTPTIAGTLYPPLGCRLILNLREAYYRPFEAEVDQTLGEWSGIEVRNLHESTSLEDELVEFPPGFSRARRLDTELLLNDEEGQGEQQRKDSVNLIETGRTSTHIVSKI